MTRVPVLCCIYYFFYVLLWQRSMMYHNSGVIVIALSGWEGLTLTIIIDCCISYRLLANKWQFYLRLLSCQPIFPLMRHYRTQYCSQHLVLNKIVDVGIQCYGKHSIYLTDYCLWQQRGCMCIKSVKALENAPLHLPTSDGDFPTFSWRAVAVVITRCH